MTATDRRAVLGESEREVLRAKARETGIDSVILYVERLMERDAGTQRSRILGDVVVRLEGFGVDPDVIEHFRTLRGA